MHNSTTSNCLLLWSIWWWVEINTLALSANFLEWDVEIRQPFVRNCSMFYILFQNKEKYLHFQYNVPCTWNKGVFTFYAKENPFPVIYLQVRFLDIHCNLGTVVNYTGTFIIIETTRLHLQFGKANHTRSSIFIKYQKFTIIYTRISCNE